MNGIADFDVWNSLLRTAQERLDNLNFLETIGSDEATQNLLNTALEDVIFQFIKVGEEELKLADEFKEILRKTRESLLENIDPLDAEFVNLREELERIFKKRNLNELASSTWSKTCSCSAKFTTAQKSSTKKQPVERMRIHTK